MCQNRFYVLKPHFGCNKSLKPKQKSQTLATPHHHHLSLPHFIPLYQGCPNHVIIVNSCTSFVYNDCVVGETMWENQGNTISDLVAYAIMLPFRYCFLCCSVALQIWFQISSKRVMKVGFRFGPYKTNSGGFQLPLLII